MNALTFSKVHCLLGIAVAELGPIIIIITIIITVIIIIITRPWPSAGNGLAGSSGGDQFGRKKLLIFHY